MFSKSIQCTVLVLLITLLLLQGCTPSFGVTEYSVWPPENYDSKNSYPGTLIFSRAAELRSVAGFWGIRQDLDDPVQLDSDWEGNSMASSSDGSRLAYEIQSQGQSWIRILDPENGEVEHQFPLSISPWSMTWARNNVLFFMIFRATGEDYETVRGMVTPGDYGYATLDLNTGQENTYFPDWGLHESQFGSPWIAFSPLGDTALVYNETWNEELGGYFLLDWNLENGQTKWAFPPSDNYAWSPDGESVAIIAAPNESVPHDEEILLIDSSTGQAKRLTYYLDTIGTVRLSGIYWSPDGRYILHWLRTDMGPGAEPDPGTLYLVDTKTQQTVNLGIPYAEAYNRTWSPDSKYFAFVTDSGIAVVDIQTFKSFYVHNSNSPSLINWTIP